MFESSQFEDAIALNSGVRLHRRRVLTAFNHVPEGPLLDVLFKLTRPPLRKQKSAPAEHGSKAASTPAVRIVRRGMVDYRRELYGDPSGGPA